MHTTSFSHVKWRSLGRVVSSNAIRLGNAATAPRRRAAASRPQSLRGRRLDGRTVLEGLGGRKLDDDRTILERLDADHGRLLAEIAQLKDSMQLVNELRKATEPRVRTSLADKLTEFGRRLAATEREREAVQQQIDEELGELMDDSFEQQDPTVPAAAGMCSDDDGGSEEGSEYGDCRSVYSGDDDFDPASSGSGSAAVQGARFEQTADTKRERKRRKKAMPARSASRQRR